MDDRIFPGVFPGGISYADRAIQQHGDYKRLAFLPFGSLKLAIERDCPAHLRQQIEADAATIQSRRGERFQISTCGQTVRLGAD
jgi:hypothetical protein